MRTIPAETGNRTPNGHAYVWVDFLSPISPRNILLRNAIMHTHL
jgi:hypothetical protein